MPVDVGVEWTRTGNDARDVYMQKYGIVGDEQPVFRVALNESITTWIQNLLAQPHIQLPAVLVGNEAVRYYYGGVNDSLNVNWKAENKHYIQNKSIRIEIVSVW